MPPSEQADPESSSRFCFLRSSFIKKAGIGTGPEERSHRRRTIQHLTFDLFWRREAQIYAKRLIRQLFEPENLQVEELKVVRVADVRATKSSWEGFIGDVMVQPLINPAMGAERLRMTVVRFPPGARTKFHTHTNEQALYVIEGRGILATEDEEHEVEPGTLVFVPVGENHWHGATETSYFTHISITSPGETEVKQ